MKILVAEDDPVSLYSLKKILEYWNHEVISVNDGDKALRSIKNGFIPQILLSDWDMPKMPGPVLCEELRKDPKYDRIYIIMLTAKDRVNDMVEGFTSGVDDYISKPVTEKELRESINNGIRFIDGEDGYTDRDDLISRNIMKFQAQHYK